MNKNCLQKNSVIILFLICLPFTQLLIGCSKSADDLYTESILLIKKDETLEKGLKNLIQFEKKFPQDNRLPEVVLAIATVYQRQESFEEAIDAFERSIEKYPESQEAYKSKFLLGYLYYDELNDSDNARKLLEDFIKIYPDSELTVSAKVLLQNIDLPVEKWSIVKEFGLNESKINDSQVSK